MDEEENEIITFHGAANLPLYDIAYDIIVGDNMNNCIAHGESLFPGSNLSKAKGSESYVCKMTHPQKDTKYMILLNVTDEAELGGRMAANAVEMSWHFIELLELTCNEKNNKSQIAIVKTIFEQITNVIATFLNKVAEDSDDDIGDL